jgi:hypothetical protein
VSCVPERARTGSETADPREGPDDGPCAPAKRSRDWPAPRSGAPARRPRCGPARCVSCRLVASCRSRSSCATRCHPHPPGQRPHATALRGASLVSLLVVAMLLEPAHPLAASVRSLTPRRHSPAARVRARAPLGGAPAPGAGGPAAAGSLVHGRPVGHSCGPWPRFWPRPPAAPSRWASSPRVPSLSLAPWDVASFVGLSSPPAPGVVNQPSARCARFPVQFARRGEAHRGGTGNGPT